ncbi:ferritin-like domain-containing protein [Pediococcus cellicola]|uniref:Stress induced DNA binding protein n=1 Tax=Pediococcus cellicola TaxID=319652 RepID=A0A0R2ILP2_9LACO|nr:ferritin-like domain-containing protein [Pediococcus cellicola]KRN65936.1 stress induced DNA binding protein [Pediococcus cellicola]GEL16011.1 DNA starvation/stationary phase protection protein [Pediococcus cellicola]
MSQTPEELFAAEQKQSEIDHHVPTAGAMVNHIVSNFTVLDAKLHQVSWYVKGLSAPALRQVYGDLIQQNRAHYDEVGELLLDEDEKPASTTDEYSEYSMIGENGKNKYFSANEMVSETVQDYVTQNLFVDRAIKLAENEDRPALKQYMERLRGDDNRAIRLLQGLIGKEAGEGLEEEE